MKQAVYEVQSGFCRTGRMFATEYWKEAGVEPDIIATAKSIAGGVPISAIIAREEIMEAPAPELTAAIINACAQAGLLVEGARTYNNVIRFLAPLVITDEQLEKGLEIFEAAIVKCV